jgi:hypothetical protein
MTPTIIKRAVLKRSDRPPETLLLTRHGKGDFRWITESGKEFTGVYYLDSGAAIRAMRAHVESDPDCVGVDLTIFDVEPPPEERAAWRLNRLIDNGPTVAEFESRAAEVIAQETNIGPMTTVFSDLMAFLMIHRRALYFGLALEMLPPQQIEQINRIMAGRAARSLALDGLLYQAITELGKSTKQDFANLLAPLKEPVSNIVQARAVPKPPEGSIQ